MFIDKEILNSMQVAIIPTKILETEEYYIVPYEHFTEMVYSKELFKGDPKELLRPYPFILN